MRRMARTLVLVLLAAMLWNVAGCTGTGQDKTDAQEREELIRILDDLSANMHPGTAGSSLTSARIVAELIGWSSTAKMDKKEAGKIVAGWLKEQTPEIRAAVQAKLESLGDTYGTILRDGAKDMLEAAGIEEDFSNLGSRVKDIMSQILASGGLD